MDNLKKTIDESNQQSNSQNQQVHDEIEVVKQELQFTMAGTEAVRKQLAAQHNVIERLRRELSGPTNQSSQTTPTTNGSQ